jgi:hypothetical protein
VTTIRNGWWQKQAGITEDGIVDVACASLDGAFEDSEDEAPAIVGEFYPDATTGAVSNQTVLPMPTKLTDKLADNEMAVAA